MLQDGRGEMIAALEYPMVCAVNLYERRSAMLGEELGNQLTRILVRDPGQYTHHHSQEH